MAEVLCQCTERDAIGQPSNPLQPPPTPSQPAVRASWFNNTAGSLWDLPHILCQIYSPGIMSKVFHVLTGHFPGYNTVNEFNNPTCFLFISSYDPGFTVECGDGVGLVASTSDHVPYTDRGLR